MLSGCHIAETHKYKLGLQTALKVIDFSHLTLQVRKLTFRVQRWLIPGPPVRQWQSWDWGQALFCPPLSIRSPVPLPRWLFTNQTLWNLVALPLGPPQETSGSPLTPGWHWQASPSTPWVVSVIIIIIFVRCPTVSKVLSHLLFLLVLKPCENPYPSFSDQGTKTHTTQPGPHS